MAHVLAREPAFPRKAIADRTLELNVTLRDEVIAGIREPGIARSARRLIRALRDAERGTGKPQTVDEFRKEIGLARSR